jgi:iron complex outermembrane recepter protein
MNGRILCGVVATLTCGAALAQSAGTPAGAPPAAKAAGGLEDIVVTANRREQNLQDVGTSIAAFSGEELKEQGVVTAADITNITPNIDVVRSYSGPGFNTQISIRGVGQPDFSDTTEATATTYVDEFYMIGAGQADFLTFDLARVEVARGPQGTVQGRNSTAGSLNYYTNRPVLGQTSGEASLTLGDYHLMRTSAFLNLPAGDTVAFRASVSADRNQGYIKNINPAERFQKGGNSDFFGARLQMLFQPNSDFKLLIKTEYGQSGPIASNEQAYETGTRPGQVGTYPAATDAFGQSAAALGEATPGYVNTPFGNEQNASMRHVLARADWNLGDGWSLVGLAGYLRSNKDDIETCDHTPQPICLFSNKAESKHSTVEFRTLYDAHSWRLTLGANYLKHDIDSRSATPLFFTPALTDAVFGVTDPLHGMYTQTFHDQQSLKSYAAFGQAEFDFADKWTLITGLRYTHDDKEYDGFDAVSVNMPRSTPIPLSVDQFLALGAIAAADPTASLTTINPQQNGDLAKFSKGMVNANLQLNYKASSDTLLYGAIRRGVKGGGFISGNAAGTPAALRKYNDEVNLAYEVGFKSTMRDIRTRLNGSVFYYDYKGMQNLTLIGITNVIANKDSTLYGGELEMTSSVTDAFEVSAGIGAVKTKVKGIYNPTGAVPATLDNEAPLAPKITANVQARYTWHTAGAEMFAQVAGKYKDGFWRDSLNNISTRMGSSDSVDLLLNYAPEGKHWHAAVWVNNVFDQRPAINKFDLSAVGGTGEIVYQAPRWYGITVATKF